MNYQAFTNETLLMMHHGARGALAVDDELARLGEPLRFKVRDTLNWSMHVSELETEMERRGMVFEGIDWCLASSTSSSQPQEAIIPDSPTHLSARIAAVMRIRKR